MTIPSQPPVPPASSGNVGDGRDAALQAAERDLQAAREALQAAERKLAEAQAAAAAADGCAPFGQEPCQQVEGHQSFPAAGSAGASQAAPVAGQPVADAQQASPQPPYQQPESGPAQGAYQQPPAAAQSVYQQPPVQPHYAAPLSSRDHVAAGLLAIFLGGFGVHKFYLGYNTQGFILLALSLVGGMFSFGLIAGVVWIISIIEGIIYLTKTQSEFEQLYVYGKHEWF